MSCFLVATIIFYENYWYKFAKKPLTNVKKLTACVYRQLGADVDRAEKALQLRMSRHLFTKNDET